MATKPSKDNEPSVTFRTTLKLHGKTATGIVVPPDVVARLGDSKRPPVRVTIGTYSYQSTIAVVGGQFLIGVSAENRAKAGVAAGDELQVQLSVDTRPRDVAIPDDFAKDLAAAGAAKSFFDTLTPSQKKWHVLAIENAKTDETRQRRIEKSVSLLTQQHAR
jgi:hypothetical protein